MRTNQFPSLAEARLDQDPAIIALQTKLANKNTVSTKSATASFRRSNTEHSEHPSTCMKHVSSMT